MLSELWGKITGKDARKKTPTQQAAVLNRIGNYVVVYPYGMYCDLPNNVLIKMLSEDSALPCTVSRPESEQGEIIIFHPVTGSKIVFKNDGSIDMTAPTINITANMNVTGNVAFTGALTSNGKNISDSHTHKDVQVGDSDSGAVS